MRSLSRRLWSHISLTTGKKQYVGDVRSSKPAPIGSYRELVTAVSRVSYNNRHSSLFFRGQKNDYAKRGIGTTILPAIYRGLPEAGRRHSELKARFDRLKLAEMRLQQAFSEHAVEADSTLSDYHVVKWAILQHYHVCATPLLDVTKSLRVACSFALEEQSAAPVLTVLGFPHMNGSISFYVDEELVNLDLLSICPPSALWPHFQEGCLVGSLPADYDRPYSSTLDVGRRLVAKFALSPLDFWDRDFQAIPHDALFPENDYVSGICKEIAANLTNAPDNSL